MATPHATFVTGILPPMRADRSESRLCLGQLTWATARPFGHAPLRVTLKVLRDFRLPAEHALLWRNVPGHIGQVHVLTRCRISNQANRQDNLDHEVLPRLSARRCNGGRWTVDVFPSSLIVTAMVLEVFNQNKRKA